MKRTLAICSLIAALMFGINPSSTAGDGGAAGITPGSGVGLFFANGGTDVFIPIRVRVEGYFGDEGQHAVGGEIGYDIGTGDFNINYGELKPYYNYHFNGGQSSGPYVGAYTDIRFRSNYNIIGVGAQGGYKHFFCESFAIFGEGNIGFGTIGWRFDGPFGGSARTSGGEFGVRAGGLFHF